MNAEYEHYLLSGEWGRKRAERLKRSEGKCEACGSTYKVEVHHLTYDRIFHESLEDLIPLCQIHHAIVEAATRHGRLKRHGPPGLLLKGCLDLLRGKDTEIEFDRRRRVSKHGRKYYYRKLNGNVARIPKCERKDWVANQPWIDDVLKIEHRDAFKKAVRFQLEKVHHMEVMGIVCNSYDKLHRLGVYAQARADSPTRV